MFGLLLAALVAPLAVLGAPAPIQNLSKRTPGRATYYQTGLGACGQWNNPGDFIVALNAAQFEVGGGYPSPQCFRGINIHYNGKTAHAVVMDECPYGGCNYGDLDMSEGLFTFFAPTSAGVFYMEWEFDGEGGSGGYTPPAPAYTPPAPAYTPPVETSSSVYVPPPSSSSSAPTPSSSSSSSDSASTTASTDDTVSAQGVENASDAPGSGGHAIDSANRAAQQLAKFIYAAGHF